MQDRSLITMEEMILEAELFQSVYPDLIGEIDRGEVAHGKLNDFQLMQAVAHAKNGLGVLSFERRQVINAVFDAFTTIYRKDGRGSAERWAKQSFGCFSSSLSVKEKDIADIVMKIDELSRLIQGKESELLQLYRELNMLQRYLAQEEGVQPNPS
ncbi:hypothetical protein ACFOLF_22155 [Paenibacillus sepulcri]|uniref:Uncharacterized protein n=1 Tax=Paenibacillus sepulcri TaxID=359917 RepID=A0ABS7C8L3_9BACL|nr:hypothetical protein [Paenibacillus sepulcri]